MLWSRKQHNHPMVHAMTDIDTDTMLIIVFMSKTYPHITFFLITICKIPQMGLHASSHLIKMISIETNTVSLANMKAIITDIRPKPIHSCLPSPEDAFPIITVWGLVLRHINTAMPHLIHAVNTAVHTAHRCQESSAALLPSRLWGEKKLVFRSDRTWAWSISCSRPNLIRALFRASNGWSMRQVTLDCCN